MRRLLTGYLVATGAGAFIALTMPSLVVLGFFLLLVPGLVLSVAPTAFLWGCLFAVAWWPGSRLMGERFGIAAALAATAAIVIAIPLPSLVAGQKRLEASLLPDILPSAAVSPSGDVRLDLPRPRWDNKNPPVAGHVRAFSCDNLCVALLFAPNVTSVTVNDSGAFTPDEHREGTGGFATGVRTYRLAAKETCGERAIEVDLEGRVGLFGKSLEENRAIAAEWNLKLAAEHCVVAGPPIAAFDMMLRHGEYHSPDTEERWVSRWSLGRSPAQVAYVEIRDGSGTVLLRRLVSRVSVLAQPFAIWPTGGIENFRFGWGRETLSNAESYAEVDLLGALKAHSTLAEQSPPADLLPQIRGRLQQALADPALAASDPAFEIMEAYFAGIGKTRLDDEDLALVTALVLDDRITAYRGLHNLNKAAADQHRQIGAAIVRRLLATGDVIALRNSGFGDFLAKSPQGAFTTLSGDERRLLASADRRVAAGGLIARLSDGGGSIVPLIVGIMRHHGAALKAALASKESATERSERIHAHSGTIEAARVALCRLGPAAASALPDIEAMISGGVVPPYSLDGHGGTDWNLMLLRLGKPMETIRQPDRLSGSEANYRRIMQERLSRFDPERSC